MASFLLSASCLISLSFAANLGQWGPTINLPLVPAAASVNPVTGKLLVWAAYSTKAFYVAKSGMTQTAEYDPVSGNVSAATISNTGHDMFCPGISLDFNGRLVVTGGDTANKTSVRDAASDTWVAAEVMNIPRGYQASCTVSDGRIFTIGGSWSGGYGGKNGEIFDGESWTLLPGALVKPMLTNDAQGIFRQDSHGWLFGWKNGSVYQAGPSKNMHWYGTTGSGSVVAAGLRGSDDDAMDGIAVMYDAVAGKIFHAGGSPSYQQSYATSNAQIITITDPQVNGTVQTINSMSYKRAFHNGVVLPDGKIFIVGGQTYAVPFSDGNSSMIPELWDPTTTKFTSLTTGPTPRNYHSVAILMPNGTIFSGGGGLCGTCTTNHLDGQLFSPPYLFQSDGVTLATRPVISKVSTTTIKVGATFVVTLSSVPATSPSFSLIRISSVTHTVNTDQRRIAITGVVASGANYTLSTPSDPGVFLPGYYYAFAIVNGVPSVAQIVKITL
ncbi:hypothetical protein MBLNU459_g0140t1 [Dothideomycetes sp. NU459]